jgi:hypothetical protein
MREQEPGMPRCWMNIEPPHGAGRKVVEAVPSGAGFVIYR